jgi:hypothetical protein
MKERDLINMFPDQTRKRERRKVQVNHTPDDKRLTRLLVITMIVLPPVVIMLISLIAYLGQKYSW